MVSNMIPISAMIARSLHRAPAVTNMAPPAIAKSIKVSVSGCSRSTNPVKPVMPAKGNVPNLKSVTCLCMPDNQVAM